MFILGEEVFFKIGNLPSELILGEVYLKYMGGDAAGIKFKGFLPHFWEFTAVESKGPYLYNRSYIFKVVKVNYDHNTLWLSEMVSNLFKDPFCFEESVFEIGDLVGAI